MVALPEKTDFNLRYAILKRIENLVTKVVFLSGLCLFCFVTHMLKITCVIKSVFGLACPGCGMTRAFLCAVRLDFVTAFAFHPMFWSLPLLVLYFLYDGRLFKNRKVDVAILALVFIGFLINWVIHFV